MKKLSAEELAELRQRFRDGQVLGDDHFLENIRGSSEQEKEHLIPLCTIVDCACEVFDVEKSMLISASQARKLSTAQGAIAMYAREKGLLWRRSANSLREMQVVLAVFVYVFQ